MTLESFVGAEEVAAFLGESTDTVAAWARQGKIPGVKPGKSWKFLLSEVNAALTKPVDPWQQSPQSRGRKRK
jgi:excisionase family DNA binding protein